MVEVDGGLISIGPDDASWPAIDIAAVPEPRTVKNRLHFDLRADGQQHQQPVRAEFRLILERQPDIEVLGEATTGAEAVALAQTLQPASS